MIPQNNNNNIDDNKNKNKNKNKNDNNINDNNNKSCIHQTTPTVVDGEQQLPFPFNTFGTQPEPPQRLTVVVAGLRVVFRVG